MKIAIDIDNTIINYTHSIKNFISFNNLKINNCIEGNKNKLKVAIQKNYGDDTWQECQSYIYSDRTNSVSFFSGFIECLKYLIQCRHSVYIISHKTRMGMLKASNINIRSISFEKILNELTSQNIAHLVSGIVFVESFDEKIGMISSINPDVIIDDLIQVHTKLHEINKNNNIRYILFGSSQLQYDKSIKILNISNWIEAKILFEENALWE